MSNIVKVELNSEGVRELLKSNEMLAICTEYAEDIKGNYGSDAEVSQYVGRNRVNASVYAEAGNNNLLYAMGDINRND